MIYKITFGFPFDAVHQSILITDKVNKIEFTPGCVEKAWLEMQDGEIYTSYDDTYPILKISVYDSVSDLLADEDDTKHLIFYNNNALWSFE